MTAPSLRQCPRVHLRSSDKTGKRKPDYLTGSIVCAAGWMIMIYATGVPLSVFTVVAAVTSFATGFVMIAFAYGREPTRQYGHRDDDIEDESPEDGTRSRL